MVLNFPQQEEEGERWEKDFFDFHVDFAHEYGQQFIEGQYPVIFQGFKY